MTRWNPTAVRKKKGKKGREGGKKGGRDDII
jgi:hypothetical protein